MLTKNSGRDMGRAEENNKPNRYSTSHRLSFCVKTSLSNAFLHIKTTIREM